MNRTSRNFRGAVLAVSLALSVMPADSHAARSELWAWLRKVRACGPADADAIKAHPLPSGPVPVGTIVAMEGRVSAGRAACTGRGCRCCNGCSFKWVVSPRHDPSERHFELQWTGASDRLGDSAGDCEMARIQELGADVMVFGRMAGNDVIADAELCRVTGGSRRQRPPR